MLMRTINDLVMDSLEERLREVIAAARELVLRVEDYTERAGSRTILLNAKEKLKTVLRE